MTTQDLIDTVRSLIAKHGAIGGYAAAHCSMRVDRGYYSYWTAHVRLSDADVLTAHGDTPDETAARITAACAARRTDPLKSAAVMPDEIDEDPEQDPE